MSLYKCCKCKRKITWKERFKSILLNGIRCKECNYKNEITIYSKILMNLLITSSIMGSGFYFFSIFENILVTMVSAFVFTILTIPLYPFLITYDCEDYEENQ